MYEPSHLHPLLSAPWTSSWVQEDLSPFYPSRWASRWCYMRTFALVSGNRRPTRPPPTSTDEAMRMGMAFVIPTREPKIRFPKTAASLHRALQNPKPVPLEVVCVWWWWWWSGSQTDKEEKRGKETEMSLSWLNQLFVFMYMHFHCMEISKEV